MIKILQHPSEVLALPQAISRGLRRDLSGVGLRGAAFVGIAFLYFPIVLMIIMSFNAGNTLSWPPEGFSIKWYQHLWAMLASGFTGEYSGNYVPLDKYGLYTGLLPAIIGSVSAALFVTIIGVTAGFMAAYSIHKYRFRGRLLFKASFLFPIIFPMVITASGLRVFFDMAGILQCPLVTPCSWMITTPRMLIGHLTAVLPYVFIVCMGGLMAYDNTVEEAAESLGAGSSQRLRWIILPLVRPALIVSVILAFNRSLHDFIFTSSLTGGSMLFLPMWVSKYLWRVTDPGVATIMVFEMIILIPALYIATLWIKPERLATGGVGKG